MQSIVRQSVVIKSNQLFYIKKMIEILVLLRRGGRKQYIDIYSTANILS